MKVKQLKKTIIRCSKCKSPLPKDQIAYLNGKIVCQSCWTRRNNGKRISMVDYIRRLKIKY